jgi:ectoine hydroxylase-related dioxygenase (phytanoyl-CoA dioxygenase family)
MNADYNRTGSKRRAGKLNVQNVYRVTSQLGTKSEGYAD